jgi:DNA mismatch repair protein MutH
MICITAPRTQDELLQRVADIAGLDLATLAERYGQRVPNNQRNAKGWAGQLVEQALGATASSRAEPDFRDIGIELKTIPISANGLPCETTYVCTVPLADQIEPSWQQAWIRKKLACVLWLPIEADKSIPFAKRRIGNAILWRPTAEQDAMLMQDWNEHMELISLGRIDEISAHHGTYLQIRPKAANSRALRDTTDEEGNRVKTMPRGFYLRTQFTARILAERYL